MLDPKFTSKLCYINSKSRNVLHRELNRFGATSDFKSFSRELNELSYRNTEYFQFIFNKSPVVLKDVMIIKI